MAELFRPQNSRCMDHMPGILRIQAEKVKIISEMDILLLRIIRPRRIMVGKRLHNI